MSSTTATVTATAASTSSATAAASSAVVASASVQAPSVTTVELIAGDAGTFTVPVNVACLSAFVKSVILGDEEDQIDGNGADGEYELMGDTIDLTAVNTATLARVVDFCTHYVTVEVMTHLVAPLKSSNMQDLVQPWYATFIALDQEQLFDLILAANYMDIAPLIQLSCAAVATLMRGKTVDEIKKVFNVEREFTEEEMEQVRAENKWVETA